MSSKPQRAAADLAGREYWKDLWLQQPQDELPDPLQMTHVEQSFAQFFNSALSTFASGSRLLEIGCANSLWMPYFARNLRFDVTGLDYSEVGCRNTRAALQRKGVKAHVICGDAFRPPSGLLGAFDIVVSLGVVEHFLDTEETLRRFADFLRPGGVLLTVVPNLRGIPGLVLRLVNPHVLRLHVVLGPETLFSHARRAGLEGVEAQYFIASNFGVLNLNTLDPRTRPTRMKALLLRNLVRVSHLLWLVDSVIPVPATRALAGYVTCVGTRA